MRNKHSTKVKGKKKPLHRPKTHIYKLNQWETQLDDFSTNYQLARITFVCKKKLPNSISQEYVIRRCLKDPKLENGTNLSWEAKTNYKANKMLPCKNHKTKIWLHEKKKKLKLKYKKPNR